MADFEKICGTNVCRFGQNPQKLVPQKLMLNYIMLLGYSIMHGVHEQISWDTIPDKKHEVGALNPGFTDIYEGKL